MPQRHFKIAAIAVAVLSTQAAPNAYADTQLPTVVVQAGGIPYKDSDATYASEAHDRAKIEASGATNLVDYLSQYTTLTVMSNFGNRFTPAIDMRGYGIANGFENIAVSIDGRRLNEIDLGPRRCHIPDRFHAFLQSGGSQELLTIYLSAVPSSTAIRSPVHTCNTQL